MTRLDCSVVNCAYNKEDSCCKDNIHVGGKNAKVTDETCCESYNHSCKCAADQIQVSGSNACHCDQTECATFKMK